MGVAVPQVLTHWDPQVLFHQHRIYIYMCVYVYPYDIPMVYKPTNITGGAPPCAYVALIQSGYRNPRQGERVEGV